MTTDRRDGGSDGAFVERLTAHLDRSAARETSAPADPTARPEEAGDGGPDAEAARVATLLTSSALWSDPPDIRATLLARVRAEATRPIDTETSASASAEAAEPDVASVTPLRRRSSWPRPAVAVPVAAAAAVIFTLAVLGAQNALEPGPDSTFTALGASGVRVEVAVTRRASGFEVTLESENLPAAPAGTYYAAWLRRGPGPGDVVPVGTFHGRRVGDPIVLWTGVDPGQYRTFSVTLQREGEPPLPNAPSAHRVLVGRFGG